MKLDPRIKKMPLNCCETDEAKQFIGKECCFSNYMFYFENIENFKNSANREPKIDRLESVSDVGSNPYSGVSDPKSFSFILPLEFVEQEKLKCRPYTFDEFFVKFQVGDKIRYRKKDNPDYDIIEVLSVMRISQKHKEISVRLSGGDYDLQGLFDTFEIFEPGVMGTMFKPFGVEE